MSSKERWRPTQYPDYLVSDWGRVKSLKWSTQDKRHFRILAQNPNKDGYMTVTLFPNKKYLKKTVHRLVAEAFCKGKSKTNRLVLHKDGNNDNNYYKNLYWGTHKDNFNDMVKHGNNVRFWTSSNCPSKKLKKNQVKRIKRILREDKTWGIQSKLAREYNVAPKTISDIKVGTNWKNIT